MTLPGSPHVAYRGDTLFVEGRSLPELAADFGTPLYVYSRTAMREAAATWQRALAGRDHLVCYAMKANSSLAVLQTFAEAGCGFDIVSGGELDRVLDLIEAVESHGLKLHHLDLGGGLGITYTDETPPAADTLVAALLERIDARGHGHRRILFEPGRSLVGNAGVLATRVLYLKPGEAKNFCIVDAAMNDLVRPAMYQAWMGIVPGTMRDGTPVTYDVVGPVCESGDWLGRDRALAVQAGDLLAVLSAGAYCMSMASNYNSRPRAAEVMVAGDQAWLVRERENPSELFRGERLLPKR
jgi:diaminopimelate decarboxylase